MNQDMDESSLLDQPSDIDELEKAKAIESIVLSSSNNYSGTFDEDEVLSDTDVENEDLVEDEDGDGDGDADDDMNETDASMIQIADSSSIATVTNSMYDESLKSTDAENGSESCMETKEMDLDSLDSERSTNIVVTEPITQHTAVQRSNSPSPSITLPPPSQPGSVSPHQQPAAETKPSAPQETLPIEKPIVSSTSSSSTTAIATATVTSSSSKSPPQQQTPNKLCYFVKFVPKASQSQPPTIVMQVPKSPPKTVLHVEPSKVTIISTSIPSAEGKTVKTVESDTSLEDEPTTSAVSNPTASLPPPATPPAPGPPLSSSSKSIGHTVNLLNNNRILIKKNLYEKHRHHGHHRSNASTSMKSTVTDSSDATKTTASSDTNALNPISTQQKKEDAVDTKSDIALCSSVMENVKFDADGVDDVNTKCEPNSSDNSNTNTALEIKREQLLNENSMDGSTTDEEKEEEEDAVDSKDTKHFVNDTTDANDSITALATAIIEEKNSQTKIKREYQQLQKTVNQSKVLSEFVIEHNKRNRRPTKSGKSKHWKHNNKTSNTSVGVSVSGVDDSFEAKMDRCSSPSSVMSESDRSSIATCSSSVNYGATITAASTTAAGKRSTRSQNTDFSAKQKRFLKGIQQITRGTDDETDNQSDVADDDDDDDVDYLSSKKQSHIAERRKSTFVKSFNLDTKSGWDKYCWRCHLHDTNLYCSCCIRSYHANCLKMKVLTPGEMHKWQCPECVEIKLAEKENKKKKFDVKHFNKLLKYAMNRILQDPNLQQFQFPVNKTQNPGYSDIIIHPINLSKIESKIEHLVYTNSEAFLSDIKWILHNCSIYFSDNYKVTRAAKALQKVSKQEVGDIETCPECYLNANTMTDNWFTEVCAKPHLILWAKLKGFPYWPAKAMSINSTLVDVRFFGEHDRANIPSKDCYLYSREDPNPPTNKYKRNTIADCVKEVDIYIENIKEKYGGFNYAELKTPFNPQTAEQHLHQMIPGLRSTRGRRRSSVARSDLTLKIVKTADNHLSVVKKEPTNTATNTTTATTNTTITSSNSSSSSSSNSTTIKQDQLPPQIKRTVDITGDGVVSRTPTPPSAILARRKTSDTRIKRSKSTNRHSDGGVLLAAAGKLSATTLDAKSYQVLRRKSMAVEKLDQKRVNVIQANLDLNSSTESTSTVAPSTPDVSFVAYNATTDKHETEVGAKRHPNSTKSQLKKRKLSVDTQEAPGPEKMAKRDTQNSVVNNDVGTATATAASGRTISADKTLPDDANILSSVGLMRKTTAAQPAAKKRTDTHHASVGAGSSGARGRPPKTPLVPSKIAPTKTKCDTTNDEISNDGAAVRARGRTQGDRANSQDDGSNNESALVLVPFLEVKKENENESSTTPTTTGKNSEPAASSTNTPILIPSSTENTPAKNASATTAEDNLSMIKTETSSDDDSLMIIDDDLDNNSSSTLINAAKKQTTPPIDELLECRGFITVRRDLSKTTGKSPLPSARKSFPKSPASAGSILKPRNLTASQQMSAANNNKPPINNMVSIPLDGLPRLDVIYNSTQPPPLSVVGSGNSVSLLSQNQSTSTSTPAAAATTAVSLAMSTNGPPPLSITAIPTVVSIASSHSTAAPLTATATTSTPLSSSSSSSPSASSTSQHNNISHLMTNLSNGTITEQMASSFTDLLVRPHPPALTARPTAPLRSEGDTVFPSEAGSASKTLINNSHKMSDFFRTVIEDTIGDLAVKHPEARVVMLELELEKERILRQKEVADLKANFERVLTEMKKSSEKDRQRVVNEIRKQCELERIRLIEDAKRKQWCANCLAEAQFYCCWNTSYCNHVCQRKHWDQHMSTCAQLDATQTNVQNMRKSNVKAQPKGEIRSQSVNVLQQQQLQQQRQPQIQTKVTQVSGQKDTNPILAATRSATRIQTNNSATIPALRNILPKNAVVSINSSSAQQRHHFNQNMPTQAVKQPSNQQPCIIVANRTWPTGTATSKSTASSLLHSNAIYLPSAQSFAIANATANSGGGVSNVAGGVSLLNTSHNQKSIPNETIIIP